jgi:hypothetical protein
LGTLCVIFEFHHSKNQNHTMINKTLSPLGLALLCILGLGMFGCGQESNDDHSDSANVSTDPYLNAAPGSETPAGIAPPKYTDTLKFSDPLAKDSVKLSIAFQRAANELGTAYLNKDVNGYAKFCLPAIEKMAGGPAGYRAKLQSIFADKKATQYYKILSGPIQRTKASLDDQGYLQGWYCLMPVKMFRREAGKVMEDIKWMGGQTLDEGKTVYFIDITNVPPENIMQIMPDLKVVLVK